MKRLLGPVLGFRGAMGNAWSLSALAVYEGNGEPPQLRPSVGGAVAAPVSGVLLKQLGSRRVFSYAFEVQRGASEQEVEYSLDGESWRLCVPAADAHPRMAFASCNGFSNPLDMRDVAVKNERWLHMEAIHKKSAALHLLLLGGDQIYADSIWARVRTIEQWNELRTEERVRRSFTAEMKRQVEAFYFDLYCERWSQPEVASVWASVPTLMTWDDHDIFDGWGSYDTDLQGCPVYQGIFECARESFRVFQLQIGSAAQPVGALQEQGGMSFGHRIGNLAVLFLDTRSERSRGAILSPRSWSAVFGWLSGLEGDAEPPPRHLLVVSAVPVLYPALRLVEWAAGIDPRHEQKRLEDDLRDHWTSATHIGERTRLVQRLLAFSAKARCRVTLLSGDVHVAALGILESGRHEGGPSNANVINQLVSSPIVHVPPGGLVRWALEQAAARDEEIDRGVNLHMADIPGRRRRIVNQRNWLELDVESAPASRLWAKWHFEGEAEPSTKVVHPVS